MELYLGKDEHLTKLRVTSEKMGVLIQNVVNYAVGVVQVIGIGVSNIVKAIVGV
jgi:hypothetical protein